MKNLISDCITVSQQISREIVAAANTSTVALTCEAEAAIIS
jgi:hypothetical protein